MAAILVKVFSLTLRTIAKPLGHQFQQWALQHPVFRQRAVNVAQLLHRMEAYINLRAAGRESNAFVGRMSDEKALEMAAKVVSEGFVFSVGVSVLFWEYLRGRRGELEKKRLEQERVWQLRRDAADQRAWLQKVNERQTERLNELNLRLDRLEEKFNGAQFKKR